MVEYLIDNIIDKNKLGKILYIVCEYGHDNIVKLLINHGADVTACDNRAIKSASRRGNYKVVKLLIDNGADVTTGNNDAIRYANIHGYHEIVELLKAHGATL